jgi:DNA-binding GntR family transcriptional regulator
MQEETSLVSGYSLQHVRYDPSSLQARSVCNLADTEAKRSHEKWRESYGLPNVADRANQGHEQILKPLKMHQAEVARQALPNHLNTTARNLLQMFSNRKIRLTIKVGIPALILSL